MCPPTMHDQRDKVLIRFQINSGNGKTIIFLFIVSPIYHFLNYFMSISMKLSIIMRKKHLVLLGCFPRGIVTPYWFFPYFPLLPFTHFLVYNWTSQLVNCTELLLFLAPLASNIKSTTTLTKLLKMIVPSLCDTKRLKNVHTNKLCERNLPKR